MKIERKVSVTRQWEDQELHRLPREKFVLDIRKKK
jgi:hypothetical protein